MRRVIGSVILLFLVEQTPVLFALEESFITKHEADLIFSLTEDQWIEYSNARIPAIGWEKNIQTSKNGTTISLRDIETKIKILFTPMYNETVHFPWAVFWGTYYPKEMSNQVNAAKVQKLKKALVKELGNSYTIESSFTKLKNQTSGIFLTISK